MADADLDVVIRSLAKQHNKTLMAAARKRHDQYMARSSKAKDKEAKAQYRHLAKSTLLHATATAKRLQNSAVNAAESYARAVKKAAEDGPPKKPAKKKAD
jgi:ribosomal protein S21